MKNNKNVIIEGDDKGSALLVWHRQDYVREAEKQLGVRHLNKELLNDPEPLISIIPIALENIRKRGALKMENINISKLRILNLQGFIFCLKYINDYGKQLADMSFLIVFSTPEIFLHF